MHVYEIFCVESYNCFNCKKLETTLKCIKRVTYKLKYITLWNSMEEVLYVLIRKAHPG